jgi:hypothetical protein
MKAYYGFLYSKDFVSDNGKPHAVKINDLL